MRKGRRVLVAEEGVVGVTDILWMICWGEFNGRNVYFEGIAFGGDWGILGYELGCFVLPGVWGVVHLNTCLGGGGIIYKSS